MPIYEYQCQKCGKQLEALQKISDAPLVDCPECGSPSLKKKISAAAFRLKGGGWYETDFKTGNQKNLHGGAEKGDGAGKPAEGGASKTSGGGDSKKSDGGDSKKSA